MFNAGTVSQHLNLFLKIYNRFMFNKIILSEKEKVIKNDQMKEQ